MSGILSPSVDNLSVGKGFMIFTPSDTLTPFHMGNTPKFTYTPKVTMLPHYSTMAGTKVQDFNAVIQKGGEITVEPEEQTANNFSLFFMGNIDATDPNNVLVSMFSRAAAIVGRLQFYQTADIGPRWNFDFYKVIINPTGAFNPISDQWNQLPIQATHVINDDQTWGVATLKPPVAVSAPENVFAPFISGPLNQGESPTFAKIGEVLTANIGGWIGVQFVTYLWKVAGTTPAGTPVNQRTYTPTGADVGKVATVDVTVTNPNGHTTVTTAATAIIHA